MKILENLVEFTSGSPQFRITESTDKDSPVYIFYSQIEIAEGLSGITDNTISKKQVRTFDKVSMVNQGDIMFSLISGTASIVMKEHNGYLYTQNYVKLNPIKNIDPKFLVYILNENKFVKKQFFVSLQGSQVLKYNLSQIKSLIMPIFPNIEKQKIIGSIYFKQLKLEKLKHKVANLETGILMKTLEEESVYDGKSI